MTDSVTARVLGSLDSTPLDFWIGVAEGHAVQLDDPILVEATQPDGTHVRFFGLVDVVRKRYEGGQFDSDAFRVAAGVLPADVSYAAHVQVTRIDPEIYVPPQPGTPARVVVGQEFREALFADRMERPLAIGVSRGGEPVYANLDFLDGTRGAHASISGVSGVATKTSYATFLLYSLFHSDVLGADATNAKALIFNVKGEDQLWLDKPNARLDAQARATYGRLGLPVGPFESVGFFAPASRATGGLVPNTGSRLDGVRPYAWTIREFARQRLLGFVFADGDDARAQFPFVVMRVEKALEKAARDGDPSTASLQLGETTVTSFDDLVEYLDTDALDRMMAGAPMTGGSLDAFRRRLHRAAQHMGHLVRGDSDARGHEVSLDAHQVTVVDIHALHSIAQMFVVGVLLKRMLETKEAQGTSRPLVFVVLDELNKYAPRDGWSPIRDVLLDIAERGRSLGVSLLGAQQTASEVGRRIVSNASLRVVGRLDSAEAQRAEYGFLSTVGRQRASLLQPGTMIVVQPEVPMPVLVRFPFPSWATRASEVPPPPVVQATDLFARMHS
jgi:DNA helicase HerA-like ATPase